MQDAARLPQDVNACHALIAELSARLCDHPTQLGEKGTLLGDQESLLLEQATTILALQALREKLTQENEELNLTIQKLLARLCGQRGERYEDPAQLKFAFDHDEAAPDALAEAAAEAERILQEYTVRRVVRKAKPRQEEFPEHLPRYEVMAAVAESQRECSEHGPREIIGYDLTKTLEFERPKLRVRITKYPKYVCPEHPACGVVEPPRPAGLVEGNRYDTGVAAEIITGKYAYHRVQGKAVFKMRVGLSRPGDRIWSQTSPNCGGQEPPWETSGVKGAARPRQVRFAKSNASEPLMKCRNRIDDVKTGRGGKPGISMGGACFLAHAASGIKAARSRIRLGNGTLEPVASMRREKLKRSTRKSQSTKARHRGGTTRSSVEGREIRLEQRGRVIQSLDNRSTATAGGTHA